MTIAENGPHQAAPVAVGLEEGLDLGAGVIKGGLLLFNERDLGIYFSGRQWELAARGLRGSDGKITGCLSTALLPLTPEQECGGG